MNNPQTVRYKFREYAEEPPVVGRTEQGSSSSSSSPVHYQECSLVSVPPSNNNKTRWKVEATTRQQQQRQQLVLQTLFHTPLTVAKELFLPIGYPHTVRDGYLQYQIYDSLQGLCSYLRGVLCSAQVLQAAGVGDESATAWAAALTWALKDGMGMVGGLVFSYLASPLFDAHVKEFRLFADLINDVALTLDMLAPYAGRQHLLLVSSASTLCKTLCGMSAAATKANITVYFASTHGNMADLNAKEATQETLVSLLGMLCGVTLARWIGNYEASHPDLASQIQWTIFIILTAVHVWANWKGVCLLRLTSLNRERAQLVLEPVVKEQLVKNQGDELSQLDIVKPTDIDESLITSTWKMFFPGKLRLNCRLGDILTSEYAPTAAYVQSWFSSAPQQRKYFLTLAPSGTVKVCLLKGATNVDELQAFVHALALTTTSNQQLDNNNISREALVLETGKQMEKWFDKSSNNNSLPAQLEAAGWDVQGRMYLGFSRRRTEFVMKEE